MEARRLVPKSRRRTKKRAPRSQRVDFDTAQTAMETFYTGEPDIQFLCEGCREIGSIPVHFMRINSRFAAKEFGLACPNCQGSFPVTPRHEVAPDGSDIYWIDRKVLHEYIPPTEVQTLTLQNRRSGDLMTVSVAGSSNVFWATCRTCGLPFTGRGDFAVTTSNRTTHADADSVGFGVCPHCGGVGKPLTTRVSDGSVTTHATSVPFADLWLATLADDLREGRIDLATATSRLRERRDPLATRLADWMESRPVTVTAAGVVLTVVASIVGPQLADDGNDHVPSGYTDEQVIELLETVLERYDDTRKPSLDPLHRETPRTP